MYQSYLLQLVFLLSFTLFFRFLFLLLSSTKHFVAILGKEFSGFEYYITSPYPLLKYFGHNIIKNLLKYEQEPGLLSNSNIIRHWWKIKIVNDNKNASFLYTTIGITYTICHISVSLESSLESSSDRNNNLQMWSAVP